MPTISDAMTWFRQTFGSRIKVALRGQSFNLDLLTALAYQETGEVWPHLYLHVGEQRLLELCVGDSLDAPNRDAFPRRKADLLAVPNGERMFEIAHAALVDVAQYDSGYASVANNPDKLCHGYGIFQYDIQFFLDDPDFFLSRKWLDFEECLTRALGELSRQVNRYFPGVETLSHDQMVYLAIAYNHGSVNVGGGFDQGYKDGEGVFYGEHIDAFVQIASALPAPTIEPALIIAIPNGQGSGDFDYIRCQTAKLDIDHFVLQKAELSNIVHQDIPGDDVQPLRSMLDLLNIRYIVNDTHKGDPDDPRYFVFLEKSGVTIP